METLAKVSDRRVAPSGRIAALDGLRAIAVVLVIVGHSVRTGESATRADRMISQLGHLGVEIFFVLSGFLITSLLISERSRTGTIDLRRFYIRRTRRIFPAYWVFLGVVGVLSLGHVFEIPLRTWLLDVFYLGDYASSTHVWWTLHTWSLAVEEQFYLVWPAVLVLFGTRVAASVATAVIVMLPIVRVLTYQFAPAQRFDIIYMFHTRLDTIMVGCVLAILVATGRLPTRWVTTRLRFVIVPVAAVVIFAGILIESISRHMTYTFTVGYTLAALSIAALLVYLLACPDSFAARMLSLAPVVWLGRISYSLYLWQELFASPMNHSLLGRFPINVFASVGLATASYYLVERTFYRPKPYVGTLVSAATELPTTHVRQPVEPAVVR